MEQAERLFNYMAKTLSLFVTATTRHHFKSSICIKRLLNVTAIRSTVSREHQLSRRAARCAPRIRPHVGSTFLNNVKWRGPQSLVHYYNSDVLRCS